MHPAPPRPPVFARQADLDSLRDAVGDLLDQLAARQSMFERALEAVIEDLDGIFAALEGAGDGPQADVDNVSKDTYDAVNSADEESPEEEAARLRREAIEQFERTNESEPVAGADINDVTDVPTEGRNV